MDYLLTSIAIIVVLFCSLLTILLLDVKLEMAGNVGFRMPYVWLIRNFLNINSLL